ncbi:MAG: acyl-CoA dehydratase activase-related protein [Tepidisphaeraceae bacterium]|jgi:hypothetical protein
MIGVRSLHKWANALRTYTREGLVSLGVSWVWIGLEGEASQYAKLRHADTHALVRELHAHGIHILGSTIIGLETHTPENIDAAIDYAVSHETEFHQFMLYTPTPGTPLHAEMSKQGVLLSREEFAEADTHGQLRFNYRHPHGVAGRLFAAGRCRRAGVRGRQQLPVQSQRPARGRPESLLPGRPRPQPRRCLCVCTVSWKEITIPPRPELLGAIGVALRAIERAGTFAGDNQDLATLAEPAMKQVGHFACAACGNHCTIDRFKVGGRRFPFGGKCSRFDTVWKRTDKVAEMADLVEARNRLVFAAAASPPSGVRRIGIPRALTAHSLYPLYNTFFSRLGMDVILSGVNPAGGLMANSGFCFPVQIAHGAVLDLIESGTNLIFLPQVSRMPNPQAGRDSYLCPIAQASPYVIAKAFPGATILSPVLDFANGYAAAQDLVNLAESQLGFSRDAFQHAYQEAIDAQFQAEQSMRSMDEQALNDALADGKPTILIVGGSYNAFPPEASQSIARKLASMGIRVIPGDCLPQERAGPLS